MQIRARNLRKQYKKRHVVDDVSLEISQGEIVGLLGPNGAGKTTTFYMLVGLIRPETGSVLLGDADITRMPMFGRARHGIGYLPQENSVFRRLTTEQNIRLVLETWRDEAGKGLPAEERRDRTNALLDELGLTHRKDTLAAVLSGGERRRVEIARVLATRPKFILLDEPFTGVDRLAISDLKKIILDLKHRGIGVLITDHYAEATLEIVDRAYILAEGQIKTSGSATDLSTDPVARQYYFGDDFRFRGQD